MPLKLNEGRFFVLNSPFIFRQVSYFMFQMKFSLEDGPNARPFAIKTAIKKKYIYTSNIVTVKTKLSSNQISLDLIILLNATAEWMLESLNGVINIIYVVDVYS